MSPMSPRLLRPRATGFNPKSLPSLKVWYDAANTGSMTFNGSTVSEMADLSGNGFTARQTTANNQPTYSATAANGRPRLAFDTTDSLLSDATVADYFLNPTTGPVLTWVMACYSPLTVDGGSVIFGSDAQANGRVFCSTNFGGNAGNIIFDTVNASGGRLAGVVSQPTAVPHIMTFIRHTSSMAWRVDGAVLLSKSNASGNFSATTAKLQIGKCDAGGSNIMYVSEVLAYASALTASQLAAVERYLASKWNITLAPQVSNADAQDWINRVYSNGGTVSATTAAAVNTFCNDIDAAGIRSKFRRLNLFAGSSLSACLVPLYKGESRTGTQYGGTTDANPGAGPFVSGDYTETGASGGLLGNATSKHLNTDFRTQDLPGVNDLHMAVWSREADVDQTRRAIGALGATSDNYFLDRRISGQNTQLRLGGAATFATDVYDTTAQSMIASRTSSTSAVLYKNGSSVATQTATLSGVTLSTQVFGVFTALTTGTTPNGLFPHRLCGYSIGAGLSAGEATSFHNAWAAFQTSLGRGL